MTNDIKLRLEEVVRQVLSSRFKDVRVSDVVLKSDEGAGGSPILRVSVVYEGNQEETLDGQTMSSFLRFLLPEMQKVAPIDQIGFPVVTYTVPSELG